MYQKMLLFQREKRNKTFLDAYLTQLKPFQWCLISKWILVQYREVHLKKVSNFFFFSYCHLKISTSSWTEASLQRKVKLLTASIVKPQTARGGVCTKIMWTLSTVRCANNRTVWLVKLSMPTWTAKNIKMISKGEHRMMKQRGKHNSFLR